jgi:hypothetical protein
MGLLPGQSAERSLSRTADPAQVTQAPARGLVGGDEGGPDGFSGGRVQHVADGVVVIPA